MAKQKIHGDLEVNGNLSISTIPNQTGTLLTLNSIDGKSISTRTNTQIIGDLGLAVITGNVATATKLFNSRTIWGQSFDGSAIVSGAMTGVTTVSASGIISAIGGNSSNWNTAFTNNHIHNNKTFLDSIIANATVGLNITGNAGSANKINGIDSRNIVETPTTLLNKGKSISLDFKTFSNAGSPPVSFSNAYSHIINIVGYQDSSGGFPSQLSFGTTGIGHRVGNSATTWGNWKKMWNSDDFTTTNVTNWNSAFTNNHIHNNKTFLDTIIENATLELNISGNADGASKLWSTNVVGYYIDHAWDGTGWNLSGKNIQSDEQANIHKVNINGRAALATNADNWKGWSLDDVTTQNSGIYNLFGRDSNNAVQRQYSAAAIKSFLGLGSNAYSSTPYLPLTGGTITGLTYFSSKIETYGTEAIRMVNDAAYISGYNTAGTVRNGYLQFEGGKVTLQSETGSKILLLNPTGGYVGIGMSPSYSLHVKGSAGFGQNTNGTAMIDAYGGLAYFGCNTAENGLSIDSFGAVKVASIKATTKMTIPTVAPINKTAGDIWIV